MSRPPSRVHDAARGGGMTQPETSSGALSGLSEADAYARAVGDRVTELVQQALEHSPRALRVDPDTFAATITDLVVDTAAPPDRSELADLVAPLWTAEHTRRVLGLSRATMQDRRKAGTLLALKTTDGDFFYPVAQFEKHAGKVRVKPALRAFMMALRDRDPWTVAILLHTPAPELGDRTPLDWVRARRDLEDLQGYAEVVNAEFAR